MTQRERHTPDGGAPRDATGAPAVGRPAPLSSPASTPPAASDSSVWEEWYHRASPAQRQEALARASREGILYAHQLAAPANAPASHRSLLSTLLNGPIEELEPLHPPALDYHDHELDRTQRDAVARAIATPDVCLIQGYPGTGKSRVVAEIILQAARRGERILFVAPTPAALDCVLERLATHSAVCPIRCLAPDELSEPLPPPIARLTLAERLRSYRENTVPAARAARDAARQAYEARLHEQPLWARLDELAARAEQLADRLREQTERQAGLAEEVNGADPATLPFRSQWDACTRLRTKTLERLDSELAGLQAELDTITGKQGHLENEWEIVRPLVEARRGHRIWTGAWWRAMTTSGLSEQVRDLEGRRAELQAARQRLEQDIAARRAECAQAEDQFAAECRRLKEEEIARRQRELDAEIAALSREQDALREQWQAICQELAPGSAPAVMSRQAAAAGQGKWQRQLARDEEQVASAEQWLRAVEEGLSTLPDKLTGCANLVAATTTALSGDAHFGDRNGTPASSFDVLILEEAHRVTESEFAAAARRARRWALVGEPQLDEEAPASPRKPDKTAALRPGFFQRLWQRLHADPHRLPFAWLQRDGRLVGRLRPIPAEHAKWIESEPVADRPEIELRIVAAPRQTPRVAEVVFPAHVNIIEAKQFIFHELDELALQTRGRAIVWSETADEVNLELAPNGNPDAMTVMLEEGVCERIACLPPVDEPPSEGGVFWSTCHLQFARGAGWTRERAEQWIAERLGLRALGRTTLLTVPYRLAPPLARFLSDLLFDGVCEPAAIALPIALPCAAVEFVAVPPLASSEGWPRKQTDSQGKDRPTDHAYPEDGSTALSVRVPRLRAVKGGAGLELDLADQRPLEQLPAELRAVLPRQGLVNYLEARALVKRLETLAHDASFRAACEQWQRRRAWPCEHGCTSLPTTCDCPPNASGPAVAVMALYPAQVELLRYLIRQTPALAERPFSLEVVLPLALGQRECLLALVSLTRSHAHRAVSYGEHPQVLAQVLTRAACGLILFGDAGTLARRSQWQGALDHLDETAARGERGLVAQLLRYLQGHGRHPATFHIREGSGV